MNVAPRVTSAVSRIAAVAAPVSKITYRQPVPVAAPVQQPVIRQPVQQMPKLFGGFFANIVPRLTQNPVVNMFGNITNPSRVGTLVNYGSVTPINPSVAAAAAAAGLTSSPYTPSGFTAPNFNRVSGGSTYAYRSNGDGTGSYVNSAGRTIPYNANG